MTGTYLEPARELPVHGRSDVIVAGGGIAGIAAALSARRAGAERVLLIEREFTLGGLATLGLITIYLPLCDGRGRQVSFGIAEELLRLSVSHGAEVPIPDAWQPGGDAEQRDLFTDYEALEEKKKREKAAFEKERRLQEAMLEIRRKYGKNAILKGTSLQEGATMQERNQSIGGHKA